MYPLIRLGIELALARAAPPLAVDGVHVSHHTCWPWDVDPWLELNNGRTLTLYDLATATRVVSFGCDLDGGSAPRVDQWDVPAVSDGYEAARDQIVARVEDLVAELAGGR